MIKNRNNNDNSNTEQQQQQIFHHDDDDIMKGPDSPKKSPAIQALFQAFDYDNKNKNSNANNTFIEKTIRTLGWRNRYSQQLYYPIDISLMINDNDNSNDNHHIMRNMTLQVMQIQGGETHGTYGTGATVWPASIVLIKYLERHYKHLVHQRSIIDLGSGTAITSLACACYGAKRIYCTDGNHRVIQLAYDNIRDGQNHIIDHQQQQEQQVHKQHQPQIEEGDITASSSLPHQMSSTDLEAIDPSSLPSSYPPIMINGCPITVQYYWWGTPFPYPNNEEHPIDLIIISDCVLPKLYPIEPLVDTIDMIISQNYDNCIAIVSYEYRYYPSYDPKTKFMELCATKHLMVTTIPIEQHDPIYSLDDIEIWHVERMKLATTTH